MLWRVRVLYKQGKHKIHRALGFFFVHSAYRGPSICRVEKNWFLYVHEIWNNSQLWKVFLDIGYKHEQYSIKQISLNMGNWKSVALTLHIEICIMLFFSQLNKKMKYMSRQKQYKPPFFLWKQLKKNKWYGFHFLVCF